MPFLSAVMEELANEVELSQPDVVDPHKFLEEKSMLMKQYLLNP